MKIPDFLTRSTLRTPSKTDPETHRRRTPIRGAPQTFTSSVTRAHLSIKPPRPNGTQRLNHFGFNTFCFLFQLSQILRLLLASIARTSRLRLSGTRRGPVPYFRPPPRPPGGRPTILLRLTRYDRRGTAANVGIGVTSSDDAPGNRSFQLWSRTEEL